MKFSRKQLKKMYREYLAEGRRLGQKDEFGSFKAYERAAAGFSTQLENCVEYSWK